MCVCETTEEINIQYLLNPSVFLGKINLFIVCWQKVKYQHICLILYQFLCCLMSVIRLKHLCEMLLMLVSEYLIRNVGIRRVLLIGICTLSTSLLHSFP